MHCFHCGHDNPESAKFCNACGHTLDQEIPSPLAGDERAILDQLYRYMPQALAEKIRALGGQLESERRHVTVMFADLSGYTALSEQLDPEEVNTITNAYFKVLVEVIFKYEGTVARYFGDEILALFGAPIAHENDPERAVRAAIEMQQRLREFNTTPTVPLPRPLTMHVGIHSGDVIVGDVGSNLRMEYSVVGDTANLAARLVAAAEAGQIFVSDKTYALTRHVIDFKTLRPFKVKGKRKKVQACELNPDNHNQV